MTSSHKTGLLIRNVAIYAVLTGFALIMIFPFIYMMTTSLKTPVDTFRYPPRLLPRDPVTTAVTGVEGERPLFTVNYEGEPRQFALVEDNIRVGIFADPQTPAQRVTVPLEEVEPVGAAATVEGEERELFNVNGQQLAFLERTTAGRFVNPDDPSQSTLANVRLSEPVEQVTAHPENYTNVLQLRNLDRSLTNTALVTILVVLGQLTTSVVGGYAFARLKFPGRDSLFLLYLGTIMIPFVLLIVPLYQLMVLIGWVDSMAALVIPWLFTAYGTFLMRQFFITVPKEIEEAALLDGASRLQILWRIFIPASVPALATLATFTFLYAWNSFFWPLVIINTGNEANHVLTLSLNVLRGRAADAPNLILAGAAIAILPPFIIFILGQRFFVESATSSGVKG